ncbi:PIN domain nuclease [Sphaerospermopsis kisseleviana CS-549]|uniref:PIN domain nuclease n=1 Tax=Sphaerospermopsis kisseleviana CS-549 TaxID=3021783 RepID=A0ABT4ZP65_9CYAN|nr:PIN domain nuclease [Sphaerospermopsis kisseleviana]MDB9441178.1 PIN domain nuclease [Sphaerospermopsis kisseleviana CS-549]BAZ81765.1 putative PilT protein [Sphaerospermopsis kisseleviana NIES-73]
MIIVDSSVWVDYFNGIETPETNKLDQLLGVEPIAISDLILTEVLQGFRSDNGYQTAKELLTSLHIFEMLGLDIAIKSADNYRFLRKQGITIRKTADVIIATFCIETQNSLLFSDKDFLPFVNHLGLIRVQ